MWLHFVSFCFVWWLQRTSTSGVHGCISTAFMSGQRQATGHKAFFLLLCFLLFFSLPRDGSVLENDGLLSKSELTRRLNGCWVVGCCPKELTWLGKKLLFQKDSQSGNPGLSRRNVPACWVHYLPLFRRGEVQKEYVVTHRWINLSHKCKRYYLMPGKKKKKGIAGFQYQIPMQ